MKKYFIIVLFLALASCWWEKSVEITFNQPEQSNKQEIKKEIASVEVPEKNMEEINKAVSLPPNQTQNNGSNISISTPQETIEFETKNEDIIASNWAVLSIWVPESFPENFLYIFPEVIYTNSLVPNYWFSVSEEFDFDEINTSMTQQLEILWWNKQESQTDTTHSSSFSEIFTKQSEQSLEKFQVNFSQNVPKAFSQNNLFSWKFIEFQYESFEGNLNN